MEDGSKLVILAVIAVLVLAGIQTAFADNGSWSSGGPYDAYVNVIAIHPNDSQKIYIGTGSSFIFKTTDGGAEWIPTGLPPDVNPVMRGVGDVEIHPFGPDTLFAATAQGAFKSTDAGGTWSQMFHQWPLVAWYAMEITQANPPVLFLGTWGSCWRSSDGGQSWWDPPELQGVVEALKADPANPNIIYAGNNTGLPNASIWKSTDSGLTWQNIHNNLQYGAGSHYAADIEVDPVDSQIVYFARKNYEGLGEEILVKSTNGGDYWTDITPPGLHENILYNVAVSPVDHNTVFVCSGSNGTLRSTDGGGNWEEANEGIIGGSRKSVTVTGDSVTGIIYLGLHSGGIYRSTNNGDSWEKISYNLTGARYPDIAANQRDSDTLFAGTNNGLYMSTDGAASWEYIELDFPDSNFHFGGVFVEVDPYDPSYVYVSYIGLSGSYYYNSALYRSTDGGANWESFTQGLLPNVCYYDLAVADHGGGARRLFMGSNHGLFRSDDLGESWSLCGGGLPSNFFVADVEVSPVDPDLVFVGNWDGGPYKSTDGGVSWALLTNPPSRVDGIAYDRINPDIVYVTAYAGIYKSTDGGQSWTNINNNIPYQDYVLFSGLAVNPLNPENIFVWSYNKGIFQSHDGGQSWEDFNENLEPTCAAAYILIDPTDTCRVFAGIWGNSVWEITRVDTTTAIAYEPNKLPPAFTSSGYPNPFNPSATIEYDLPEEAFVTVEIYDLLGRRVETLVSAEQQAGSHQVVWDAGDRASGVYFYRIAAGEHSDMKKMILLK